MNSRSPATLHAERPDGAAASPRDAWLTATLGVEPRAAQLYVDALTHPSASGTSYQRLEFLGDRVLGLAIAQWLFERFPHEREGQLSHRLTTLVSGASCAEVARELGVGAHLILGKQARDDGAGDSDNILGDVVEALIGALFLDHGLLAAQAFVRRAWGERLAGGGEAPRHPKSLLHEWAEANRRRAPVYEVVERRGPDHAPRFTVRASLGSAGEAIATGTSKHEAETAAARALLERLGQ